MARYKSPISLALYDPLAQGGGPIGDFSLPFLPTWRRSIARMGGYKLGTVNLTTEHMTPDEMGRFFRGGLLREIREIGNGQQVSWQGLVTRMEWTHRGDVFTLDINKTYNARRAIYRRLYDNALTNGSAESGAWAAFNSATVTQSTEWVTDGTYSCKIVVADAVKRGAFIQTDIPIVADVAYTFSARMNVLSGSWAVEAYRSDNNTRLVRFDSRGQTGDVIATFTIPATNTYAGNIYLRVSSIPAAGAATCYLDGAVFKSTDQPSDTGWKFDYTSMAYFGRKEWIDLWGGMSSAAANARVTSDLALSAWPQTDVPAEGVTRQIAVEPNEDKLSIVFSGYWITLNWLYTNLTGTAAASTLVNTLAAYQSAYITIGEVTTNALSFQIEDGSPLRVGDVLVEIAESGDASGNMWSIGVYADRKLYYQQVARELTYHLRGGRLLMMSGNDIDPWMARPGWANVDDLPIGPSALSGLDQDDVRWRYLEEIEMLPPDSDHVNHWLSYRREAL